MSNYTPLNEYDRTIEAIEKTLTSFSKFEERIQSLTFMMGFDGYIDLLYNMVKNRTDLEHYEIYTSMAEFGKKIIDTAGSSASIERVLKKKLAGGFAPNMARAISNMAPQSTVHLYAAMGYPNILELFTQFNENVVLHTVGNPGETLAMEFEDGKIMSQDMGGIFEMDWNTLKERMGGTDAIIKAFNEADAIGNGHWSLMLTMNDFFEHFIEEIIPNVKDPAKKLFFVDPADLSKRSHKDIRKMLNLLSEINKKIPVVLSLNDREAINVAEVLNKEGCPPIEKGNPKSYEKAGLSINNIINLNYLVIHDPHFATITHKTGKSGNDSFEHVWITEGYTSKPKFTVAAGDHFNAGILMSLLSGLTPMEALVIANAATAIFVRTGKSPSTASLRKFIENYFDYIVNDIDEFEL